MVAPHERGGHPGMPGMGGPPMGQPMMGGHASGQMGPGGGMDGNMMMSMQEHEQYNNKVHSTIEVLYVFAGFLPLYV